MKVYYVRHNDEEMSGDCIWDPRSVRFFSDIVDAHKELEAIDAAEQARWDASYKRNYERWEKVEVAYQALTDMGIDAREVLPYHRPWAKDDERYVSKLVIDWINVEE